MPLRTRLLEPINVHGCSMYDTKRKKIGDMFVRRNFDVMALSEKVER